MYCSHCGKKNADESLFCVECGCPLRKPAVAGAARPAGAAVGMPTEYVVPKGCVGQAWSDITSSPNWVKRVLTLMLMNCVPVLNFFAVGYGLQWGAQAAKGEPKPLAVGAFCKKTFGFGLIIVLLDILLAAATIVFGVLSFIPILGAILLVAINLLASTFCELAKMRVGVTGKLGSAFDLSELFRAYRKNLGGLFAAAIVPQLICGVVVVVVIIVLVFLAGLSGYAAYTDFLDYGHGYGYGYSFPSYGVGYLGGAFALVIVAVVLALFIDGLGMLWAMRAVGHWVHRNEPQWANEGTVDAAVAVAPVAAAAPAPVAVNVPVVGVAVDEIIPTSGTNAAVPMGAASEPVATVAAPAPAVPDTPVDASAEVALAADAGEPKVGAGSSVSSGNEPKE